MHMLFPLIVFPDFVVLVFSQLLRKIDISISVSEDLDILIDCKNFMFKNVIVMCWIQSKVIFEKSAKFDHYNNCNYKK